MTTNKMRPSFKGTTADLMLVERITERAITLEHGAGTRFRKDLRLGWHMDLLAANNSCPLDLAKLADADNFNFAHDVYGIRAHINRETGELGDSFLPRFAIKQKKTEVA